MPTTVPIVWWTSHVLIAVLQEERRQLKTSCGKQSTPATPSQSLRDGTGKLGDNYKQIGLPVLPENTSIDTGHQEIGIRLQHNSFPQNNETLDL